MDYRKFNNQIIVRIDKGEEILEKIKDVRPYFDEYINQLLQDD